MAVRGFFPRAWFSLPTPCCATPRPAPPREELVTRNVAKLVRVSTPHYEVGQALDSVTARTFLASIREDRLYALYLCAVVLGLRRSELLGLA